MPLALKQVEILARCKERQTLLRVLSCMWPEERRAVSEQVQAFPLLIIEGDDCSKAPRWSAMGASAIGTSSLWLGGG